MLRGSRVCVLWLVSDVSEECLTGLGPDAIEPNGTNLRAATVIPPFCGRGPVATRFLSCVSNGPSRTTVKNCESQTHSKTIYVPFDIL